MLKTRKIKRNQIEMNMEEYPEFQKIGKKTPYKVPEGFFEDISEKTLLNAKQKMQIHKKRLVFRSVMATIGAAAAVILFIFLKPGQEPRPVSNLTAQKQQETTQPTIQIKQETTQVAAIKEIKEAVPAKNIPEKSTITEEKIPEEYAYEDVEDILNDLSDEELLQLAAMYKEDQFIDVLSQETTNIN